MTGSKTSSDDPKAGAAAFHAAPHGYLLLDTDFYIVDVNQRYTELTQTRREDLVGVGVFDAFPDNPQDPTADGVNNLRQSLEVVLNTQKPHTMAVQKYDIPVRDSTDGRFEERYWQPLNTPVLRNGEVIGLIHHVEDVTSEMLYRRDQAIRLRTAQRLQELAFWEFDPSTDTVFASKTFAVMHGLSDQEGIFSADAFFVSIPPEDRIAMVGAFDMEIPEAGDKPVAFTYRAIQPDGCTRWISSHGEIVRETRDALPRFMMVSMDITIAKRREHKLAQAVDERDLLLAQKETLLAEVNHRIKNSLQLVSSILKTDARRAQKGEIKERLERAVARVRAVTSVHEMLYRSNEIASVEFGIYLREFCKALEAGEATHAPVTVHCDPIDVKLHADQAIPLALMVNELVTNSIKHGLSGVEGDAITVKTSLDGQDLVLQVADNGTGKPGDAKPGQGSFIIEGLVVQLGAKMVTAECSPGYSVTIRIPYEAV